MDNPNRHSRLSTPLMHVFRAAHEAKDAKRIIDQRNEAGERVIAAAGCARAKLSPRACSAAKSHAISTRS